MKIGLIIVGDEILSGRRTDKHLPKIVEILKQRSLSLDWVRILGDDPDDLEHCYRDSFARGDLVFSTGGIGATPDDLTREAVARARGIEMERHPEGKEILEQRAQETGRTLTPEGYRLIEFPAGSELVPNPFNGIPGFALEKHYFVPGFPQMAWPMIEWVLDTHYPDLGEHQYREYSLLVHSANESQVIPAMETIMRDYPEVKAFSLPIIGDVLRIELGVKGPEQQAKPALAYLKQALNDLQLQWDRH